MTFATEAVSESGESRARSRARTPMRCCSVSCRSRGARMGGSRSRGSGGRSVRRRSRGTPARRVAGPRRVSAPTRRTGTSTFRAREATVKGTPLGSTCRRTWERDSLIERRSRSNCGVLSNTSLRTLRDILTHSLKRRIGRVRGKTDSPGEYIVARGLTAEKRGGRGGGLGGVVRRVASG